MGFVRKILILCLASLTLTTTAEAFNCSSSRTCNSMVGYVAPNTTTIDTITQLFGVMNYSSFLGANGLPTSTPNTTVVSSGQTIKIPFTCVCSNGTGISNRMPIYTVVPDDGLDHIATEVFSRLVTVPQIQAVNNISNANLIVVGRRLLIPLPCSCDDVNGDRVVHYGHVVVPQSTVEGIAQVYNISANTLLSLNGLADPRDLQAGAVIDVPLRACTSMVNNTSMDYPLLVTNGTYTFTANQCVMCNCDAANNWILQCEPSQTSSSRLSSCPPIQCQGVDNLYLGNTTSSNCNRTTCVYAGYTNQNILTALSMETTCPVSGDDNNNKAPKLVSQGWSWNLLIISIHLVWICIHLFH